MNKAVFLDRDGVINDKRGISHIASYSDFVFYPGVAGAINIFNGLGLKVIVVTNQPAVARGIATERKIREIHGSMIKDLKRKNARIDAVYFCPHHPEKHHGDIKPESMKYRIECDCRKPKAGMLRQAAKDFNIDLPKSFMIGDTAWDVLAGKNAGCKTIMVKTGDGRYKDGEKPDFVFISLLEAALFIKNYLSPKAVILAGGRGERLRPLTDKIPKPMLPVNGRPLLLHQVKLLKKYGIKNIVICGHYMFDKIKYYFGDGKKFGVNITYKEDTMLGTGGAIKNAEKYLNSTFFLIYGDELVRMNLKKLLEFHRGKNAMATLVLHNSDHPEDSDMVELANDGLIKKIYPKNKKRPAGLMLSKTGIYVIEPDMLRFIKLSGIDLDREVLPKLIGKKMIYGYVTDEYIRDIGTPERYQNVKKLGRIGKKSKID